mmetsp:Transcript_9180/g.31709  ORF Transcript_9180/g.31709 Transcript_9180/m.31709 type:complete len:320 (-) Transcript_9180:506-1465(-)
MDKVVLQEHLEQGVEAHLGQPAVPRMCPVAEDLGEHDPLLEGLDQNVVGHVRVKGHGEAHVLVLPEVFVEPAEGLSLVLEVELLQKRAPKLPDGLPDDVHVAYLVRDVGHDQHQLEIPQQLVLNIGMPDLDGDHIAPLVPLGVDQPGPLVRQLRLVDLGNAPACTGLLLKPLEHVLHPLPKGRLHQLLGVCVLVRRDAGVQALEFLAQVAGKHVPPRARPLPPLDKGWAGKLQSPPDHLVPGRPADVKVQRERGADQDGQEEADEVHPSQHKRHLVVEQHDGPLHVLLHQSRARVGLLTAPTRHAHGLGGVTAGFLGGG